MGVEGQFTESFAGWSHEVRRDQALAHVKASGPTLQLPQISVPNIVKYRLLPTTAVVAIALAVPSVSSDAGAVLEPVDRELGATPAIAPGGPSAIASPQSFALQEELVLGAATGSDWLATPVLAAEAVDAVPRVEVLAAPVAETSKDSSTDQASGYSTFEGAFAPFSEPQTSALSDAKPATLAVLATVPEAIVLPETADVFIKEPSGASLFAVAPNFDPVVEPSEGSIGPVERLQAGSQLPIAALSDAPIGLQAFNELPIETVSVPLIEIAALEEADTTISASADASRSLALLSNSTGPAVSAQELVQQRPSARQTIKAVEPAATPASSLEAPTSAAIAPQLTALPPGKGGPARTDAMPIEVVKPQAVPAPAAKTSVSSAQPASFASVVDPRRPASQPVSGTVSGLDLKIRSQLITRIDGRVAGQLEFQQTNRALSVRLGSIVELLKDRYDMREFERITASAASDVFVTMAQLRDAGIPITYDPVYDEFNVGSRDHRPTNAHKVQIDQIGSAGVGAARSKMDQARP